MMLHAEIQKKAQLYVIITVVSSAHSMKNTEGIQSDMFEQIPMEAEEELLL